MIARIASTLALVAALSALYAPAQAAPRTFEAVNQTSATVEVVYKKFPEGALLLDIGLQPGKSQTLTMKANTVIYVAVDQPGCREAWTELTPDNGDRTFYIRADCKVTLSP